MGGCTQREFGLDSGVEGNSMSPSARAELCTLKIVIHLFRQDMHMISVCCNTNGRAAFMSESKLLLFFGRGLRSSDSLPEIPAKRPKTASVESSSGNEGELHDSRDNTVS